MGKESVILEKTGILKEICGSNDRNLKIIESALNARIFSYGNELIIECDDPAAKKIFKKLVTEIEEFVGRGQEVSEDLIVSLVDVLRDADSVRQELLRESVIQSGTHFAVFPRNANQAGYINAMDRYDMVFSIGPAGTGKTYLAIAHALREILSKRKKKLILTRPVVEAGENLGFLPGDLTQKLNPYLRPIYDAMDDLISAETVARMEEQRIIEVAPLAYMRGRSLKNSYIILDEAQNTTITQMKMFLTRMGENSKVVVTGDITQVDLPVNKKSGLIHAARILKDIKDIFFIRFGPEDVVRNKLVREIIRAYEKEKKL